jgi:excisionase family DNA binding protein
MATRTAIVPAELADMVRDGFLTVPDAARFLGISRSKVYLLMDDGELIYAKFGSSRRVPRQALIDYATRNLIS